MFALFVRCRNARGLYAPRRQPERARILDKTRFIIARQACLSPWYSDISIQYNLYS